MKEHVPGDGETGGEVRTSPTEAEIQRAVMDLLAAMRIPAIRFNSGSIRDARGVPVPFARWMDGSPVAGLSDIVALIGGRAVFLEIKTATGKQRPSQVDFQRWAEQAGCEYRIVRDAGEVVGILSGTREGEAGK